MNGGDIAEFTRLLDNVASLLSRGRYTPNDDATMIFFRALERHSMDAVRAAFQAHVQTSPFPPTPADILGLLRTHDGRLDVEEAWALAVTAADEATTVVWTAEIAEAWRVAQPIMHLGDKVGARMAFKSAYERIVTDARARMVPVEWVATLGHDPEGRERAIKAAADLGRVVGKGIGATDAVALPAPRAPVALLAANPASGGIPEEHRARLLRLREALTGKGYTPGPGVAAAARTAELRQGAAARVAAYAAEHGVQLPAQDDRAVSLPMQSPVGSRASAPHPLATNHSEQD